MTVMRMYVTQYVWTDQYSATHTVNLHDGSYRFSQSIMQKSNKADAKVIQLPTGSLYDPLADTQQAPIVPQQFSHELLIVGTTANEAETIFNGLLAGLGWQATVTGKLVSAGTTKTCTARLIEVSDISSYAETASLKLRARLTWLPSTDWA